MSDVKGYMKHIQKSRWAINFDFAETTKRSSTYENEVHS